MPSSWQKKLDNADELNEHLQQLHPVGYGIKTGDTLLALLELRGREVLPYVRKHLPDVIGGWWDAGPQKFVEFAKQREWWDLWATAIRASHDPKQFNEAVHSLLNDTTLSEPDRLARFRELAGVSREANWPGFGMMQVHALKDDLAEQVYNRYPLLIHGPLKPHVTPTWWQPYPKLLAAARSASDEELIDLMASRFVTRVGYDETSLIQRAVAKGSTYEQTKKANESLAEYYGEILQRDPASFACRASEVLTRVPAFTIYNQRQLLKTNPLARLLFVRSFDTYLSSPEAVRDLVEASEIHVQMLGYRVLARDDDRAREMGASMLDILLGTLLRPLHRKTRMAAFTALANAAKHDTESATVIHSRARQALRLPDKRYPKEELIGLIGEILHACPSLRGEAEQPQVFGMERFQTQSEAMSCS